MSIRPIHTFGMVVLAVVIGLTACSRDKRGPLEPAVGLEQSEISTENLARRDRDNGREGERDDVSSRNGLPEFERDDFQHPRQNPYFPLVPGTTYKYVGETEDGTEVVKVEVTRERKRVFGVNATVVRDRVYLDGELIEDTFDWYAPDEDGNVWYLGEDTKAFDNGTVSTEGSWEAGKNGARPGVIMLANPRVGDCYPQEIAPGVAEDRACVVSLNATARVPFGTFHRSLKTRDTTPLEPGFFEFKYYARGVGLVLEVSDQGERVELKSVTRR
jgi:hypothetical protein